MRQGRRLGVLGVLALLALAAGGITFAAFRATSANSGDILEAGPRGIEYDDLVLTRPGRLHSRHDLSQFGMNRRARHEVARDGMM